MTRAALLVLALAAPAAAQMPDLRNASGIALPSPDMPAGLLAVRVVRGDQRRAVVGEEVVVVAGRDRRTAKTGEDGRAYFKGLPAGVDLEARWGEVRSRPFRLGASGARMALFSEAPAGAAAEAAPPAAVPHGGAPHGGAAAASPHGSADPARMAGLVLPSAELPAGSIVGRIGLGGLKDTLPGADVIFAAVDGETVVVRRVRADADGRARVDGLPPGGRASGAVLARDRYFPSASFEVPREEGGRVLLFVPAEGEPQERAGEADPALPSGAVAVAVTSGGTPVAGAEVSLWRAGAGGEAARQAARTGADGVARFEAQPAGDFAYVAAVAREGAARLSPPFRLPAKAGARVALALEARTRDAGRVAISGRSHLVADPGDEEVEILEVVELVNSGDATLDPGPAGLTLWLPEGQSGAALDPEQTAPVTVEDDRVVWKGPIEPGSHEVRFFFRMKADGEELSFRQKSELAWSPLTVAVRDLPGLALEGAGFDDGGTTRDLGGQAFRVFRAGGVRPGEKIAFTLRGLPHVDQTPRDLAAVAAALILLWGVVAAWRKAPGQDADA